MSKLPWFPFWVDAFLSDENVLVMTNEEVGIYVKLLCHQWKAGSIPSDLLPLAKLCGTKAEAMETHWRQIGKCFGGMSENSGRLINPRLEEERQKQQNKRKARRVAGLRGAEARWKPHGNAKDLPMAKNGESELESESELELEPELHITTLRPVRSENPGASKTKTKGKKPQGTPTPADFKPTPGSLEWLRRKYGEIHKREIDHQTEQFLQHGLKSGKIFVDWQAAWKNWMNNWKTDFGRNVPLGPTAEGPYPWEANGDPNLIRDEEDDHQQQPPVP